LKLPLLLFALGFLLLPFFPALWRTGLALGWGVAWVVEALSWKTRKTREISLRLSLALGFLLRFALLFGGAFTGKLTGAYEANSFLLAFLVAFAVSEPLILSRLAQKRLRPGSKTNFS